MNDDHAKWLTLWSRMAAGEDVGEQAQAELRSAIKQDRHLREAILGDRNADLLLSAHFQRDRIKASEDAFVEDTLLRWRKENSAGINERNQTASPVESTTPPPIPVNEENRSIKIEVATERLRRPVRRRRAKYYRLAGIASAALVFISLTAFAIVSWMNQHNNNVATQEDPDPVKNSASNLSTNEKNKVATLLEASNAVWERDRVPGDVFGPEEIHLLKGDAKLELADGAILNVSAPTRLKLNSADDVLLSSGQIAATVPERAIGFKVNTPTSQIVDLGTEFDVVVDDIGETDVFVRSGKVDVYSNVMDPADATWQLTADDMNRARFYRHSDSTSGPVAADVHGNDGRFQGMISVNGQMMRFNNSQAFDSVRRNVMQRFSQDPSETVQAWSSFVTSSQSAAFSSGSVSLNGVEVEFNNIEEAIQLQQKIQEKMQQAIGSGNSSASSESFSATIVINGKVRTFTSREEYEAAKKEIFGGAADFGAGKLDDK